MTFIKLLLALLTTFPFQNNITSSYDKKIKSFKGIYETSGERKFREVVYFSADHEMVLTYSFMSNEPRVVRYYDKVKNIHYSARMSATGYTITNSLEGNSIIYIPALNRTEKTKKFNDIKCTLLESEGNKYGGVWVDMGAKLIHPSKLMIYGDHLPHAFQPATGETRVATTVQTDIEVDEEILMLKGKYVGP